MLACCALGHQADQGLAWLHALACLQIQGADPAGSLVRPLLPLGALAAGFGLASAALAQTTAPTAPEVYQAPVEN
ncbi:hypothetical protein ACVBEH_25655, partial [Roseateles sp. GG27B]